MAGTALTPRDYVIEEYTKTVCPACFAERPLRSDDDAIWRDGMLVSKEGSIWMRRRCPVHGESESLYEESAELWRARSGWSTPTLAVIPDRADNFAPFPEGYREGLPAAHGQHTCILLLNIIENCNLSCPTCYASARTPGEPIDAPLRPTLDEIERTVDTMIEREGGQLGVLMLSGGEPTLRRDLGGLLQRLASKPITRILLNTNGRRIARDPAFAEMLSEHSGRIEAYVQFDGFEPATSLALRGEDVSVEKRNAIEALQRAGVFTTLVMTVKRGVNEHEIGAVAQFALGHPRVSGLAIQPVFGSGRESGFDPLSRTTPTGVLKRLEEQSSGRFKAADFIPLPCSHKDCCDIGYFVKGEHDTWVSILDLVGREELKKWIHLVSNTISFESASDAVRGMIRDGVLQRLFSERQKTNSLDVAGDLFRMCGCVPGASELLGGLWAKMTGQSEQKRLEKLAERTFRVTVKMFMDAHTLHEARIRQCCVHVGTFEEDPRRYSFCWRWLFADASDFPEGRFQELEPLAVRA